MPAMKPAMAPQIEPHLFAFFQLTQRAIGTTAEPRKTPMNSYGHRLDNIATRQIVPTHVKPAHRDANIEEYEAKQAHNESKENDLGQWVEFIK